MDIFDLLAFTWFHPPYWHASSQGVHQKVFLSSLSDTLDQHLHWRRRVSLDVFWEFCFFARLRWADIFLWMHVWMHGFAILKGGKDGGLGRQWGWLGPGWMGLVALLDAFIWCYLAYCYCYQKKKILWLSGVGICASRWDVILAPPPTLDVHRK